MRRTARVLCVDSRDRVLLLRWRDPVSGDHLWEPPGGGIEAGETPEQAAVRELREETGLDGRIEPVSTSVPRDSVWNGARHVGVEEFFLARFDGEPELSRDGLEAYETGWLVEHAWVPWDGLPALPDRVEPPALLGILARLDPNGPWAGSASPSGGGSSPR